MSKKKGNTLVSAVTADNVAGVKKNVVNGRFRKIATTPMERAHLRNEARLLAHLEETGFTPKFYDLIERQDSTVLLMQYLGESQPVTDEVLFRRNCAQLLIQLNQAGVFHGDLTEYNLIVKNNKPYAVDWAQSRMASEPGPDKRPEGDAHHLWESARKLSPDTARHIRKWQAIRPFVLTGSIVDLGCWQGDYTLFALAENPNRQIVGIEGNIHNYETAVSLWGHGLISYVYTKLVGDYWLQRHWDTSFCMSVYPYLVQDYGRSQAAEFLRHTVAHSGQHFFETQLYGDGPGPDFFRTDEDVRAFLESVSGGRKVEALATIHVHGRNFDRTVWRIS